MADRKAELAAKKKKLEELRRQRETRYGSSDPSTSVRAPSVDVTELVSSLLRESGIAETKTEDHLEEKKSARRPAARSRLRSRANLTKSETKINSWNPPELIVYVKGTQTEFADSPSALAAKKEEEEEEKEQQRKAQEEKRLAEEQRRKEEQDRNLKIQQEREQEEQKPSIMAPEKASEILHSADFQSFFDRSSKLIERALNEPYDVCVDYARDENSGDGEGQGGNDVRLSNSFFHPRYSANRVITCMDWSTKHPELLVASYNANEDAPNDPDGIVLVWNTHLKSTPEFVFECQSSVLSCCFSPWQPNIVIGGTYSGQIVLWDNRSKRTPEQRSALSAQAHTHPVYCLDLVGTQNAHNLVSISTDGKLCTWNLDMLTTPTPETLDLQLGANKPIAPTCMSFPKGDINNFVVGSEEGALYAASRHNTKAGLVGEVFEGHSGPVTSVDFHKAAGGSSDFSHLFLSSSTDWTVKLWSYRSKTPIYSFEDAGDYVLDVQWSPIHPSLFASADGMGQIDFWNPNTETEAPVKSVDVAEGKHAINRIKWSNNGHQIAAGDAEGRIHIYDVSEKLAVPRADEWSRFKDTLVELQQSAADIEAVASGTATLAP